MDVSGHKSVPFEIANNGNGYGTETFLSGVAGAAVDEGLVEKVMEKIEQ